MRSFRLNKLVRDRVYASMLSLGQKVAQRRLNDEEFLHELQRKLVEEAKEFDPADEKAADELADLLEVIETLGAQLGKDFGELRELQAQRQEERGGFAERIYVERLDLKDNDSWTDYYAADPQRFSEVKSE